MKKLNLNLNIEKIFRRSNHPDLTWMMASTFHDIAYPLELIDTWVNDLLKLFIGINPKITIDLGHYFPPIYIEFMKMISQEHNFPLRGLSSNAEQSMDWKFYNILNEKIYEKNHGVLSCLILAHELAVREGFFERDGYYGTFSIDHIPSCHAICCHTLEEKIEFKEHPYAFLLRLCDELQDWGRPILSNRKNNDLMNICVSSEEIPRIDVMIKISYGNKGQFKKALSKHRLGTNGLLEINFESEELDPIHSL